MDNYLFFENLDDANIASNKLWCNLVLQTANNEEKLVGNGIDTDYFLDEMSAMTESQICELKIYSKLNDVIQNRSALTIKYQNPYECLSEPGKYIIKKPDDENLLVGVNDYTIKVCDINWFPSYEI